MKSVALLACLLAASAVAFQSSSSSSSFVGRAAGVCSREELRMPLSCPPTRTSSLGRRSAMSMPPFLRKLGLRRRTDDEDTNVAVVEPPTSDATADDTMRGVTALEIADAQKEEDKEDKEEMSKGDKMMQQVKDAGVAGAISLAFWELGFWAVSLPVCVFGYREVAGHWPDFTNAEDMQKLGAEAFAFVNFARFAVPFRVGLALSTTPWIEENIVEKYLKNKDDTVNPNGSDSANASSS